MAAIRGLIGEMSPEQLRETLDQVMSMASDRALTVVRAQRGHVHRGRRPRREIEETLQVRMDLVDAKPPIWRRLELSSTLGLADVHDIIQAAFGWTDSHLHRFALGPSVWDEDFELFLCPYDVQDGEVSGIPASEVRLDEVLGEVDDELLYVYDYGDNWELRIHLEAIDGRVAGAPRAVCTGGRRAAPPEDFGGIYAYDEHVHESSSSASGHPETFDVTEVNESLLLSEHLGRAVAVAPPLIATMLRRSTALPVHDVLADMVVSADLGTPAQISIDDATAAVRRYAWLLDRIGDDGITLTAAGYLPPVHVSAAMAELGLDQEWIGKGNREDLTMPVLQLRESARWLGLVRKQRGRLLLTAAARRVRQDPVALWWHIAGRLPEGSDASIEHHAGVLYLLGIAADRDTSTASFRAVVADVLTASGWHVDGGRVPASSVHQVSWETVNVLSTLDAFGPGRRAHRAGTATAAGRAMARAALQHSASRLTR